MSLVVPGPTRPVAGAGNDHAGRPGVMDRVGLVPASARGHARLRGRTVLQRAALSWRQHRRAPGDERRQSQRRRDVRVRQLVAGRRGFASATARSTRATTISRTPACSAREPVVTIQPIDARPVEGARGRFASRDRARRRGVHAVVYRAAGCRRSGRSRRFPARRSGPSASITSKWPPNANGRACSSSASARSARTSTIRS